MNVRTLPYGYCYENGVIVANHTENNILQLIFNEYLHGKSLLDIAENLNANHVEYRPGIVGWNKSRIMRLLEDERYTGTEVFPALITKEMYCCITKLKLQKSTQQKINRKDAIYNLDVPMYCPDCGSPMRRKHSPKNAEKWVCEASTCGTGYSLPDSILLSELTGILNQLITNPDYIQETHTECRPSMELIRLQNEITQAFGKNSSDKEELRKKLFEYTARRYTEIDTTKYITQKLKVDFEKSSPLSAFSIELFQLTVKSLFLTKDGTVGITLLNGQQFGKE